MAELTRFIFLNGYCVNDDDQVVTYRVCGSAYGSLLNNFNNSKTLGKKCAAPKMTRDGRKEVSGYIPGTYQEYPGSSSTR